MCRILKWVFAAAYVVALFLFAVGTWGSFGADRDPLAGVLSFCSGCHGIFLSTLFPMALRQSWPRWPQRLTWPFSFQSAPPYVGDDSAPRPLRLHRNRHANSRDRNQEP